jgi:hypothetical protein
MDDNSMNKLTIDALKNAVKYSIALSILFGTQIVWAVPVLDKEVQNFIPDGHTVLVYQTADLNGDGRQDAILVFESNIAEISIQQPRTLMILLRDNQEHLSVAEQNNEVFFCKACLGTTYETYQDVKVKKNTFSVSNEGGGVRYRWNNEFVFKYSLHYKTWLLSRVNISIKDISQSKLIRRQSLTYPNDLKKIRLSKFTAQVSWRSTP